MDANTSIRESLQESRQRIIVAWTGEGGGSSGSGNREKWMNQRNILEVKSTVWCVGGVCVE